MARIAALQHGCAHRRQLVAAGIGRGAIAHRLKTHRLHLLHRGVYLVDPTQVDGWTPTMAAILLFGGCAVASHRVAGAVWEMLEDTSRPRAEVTLVARAAHSHVGVTIHRVSALHPNDTTWRRDLPVTSPARTVVDLAGTLDMLELENALAICRQSGMADDRQIRAALGRAPQHAGSGRLRQLLERGGFSRTRSYYERFLLKLIGDAGLPRPVTNSRVGGHNVDMVWPEGRLVVEFDGFKFHGDRRAFESDRRRDQDLVAAGYRVIRITARQLEDEPFAVIARLAAALA